MWPKEPETDSSEYRYIHFVLTASYYLYLDVGREPRVDPVRSQHVRQRGGAGEAGGHSVAHFRQRKHLEAKLLILLLQLFIRLLLTLTQDAAHHVATFL